MEVRSKKVMVLLLACNSAACGYESEESYRPPAVQPPPIEETINPYHPGMITVRDAEGQLVDNTRFSDPGDVYLFGLGLEDGQYYYQVADPNCTTLLAGPSPSSAVPDTAKRVITVTGGGFAEPLKLAPFAVTPNEQGRYIAAIVPVSELAADDVGCFGFPELVRETAEFRIGP